MNKRTILIFTIGLIILLGLSYFSNKISNMGQISSTTYSVSEDFNFDNFDMSYENVLDQVGGGKFQNDDVEVSFTKDWIINKQTSSLSGNDMIKNTGEAFFNAYSIGKDNSTPWIFSINKRDTFETLEYIAEIEADNGEIIEGKEDGSFIMQFDNESNKDTVIMQKIVKTNDQKFITISLLTVNASLEKVKEIFKNLLKNTTILNYSETVFLPVFDDENEEEENTLELENGL